MRTLLFSLLALVSLTLTACSTLLDYIPGVYSLEIQQGNMVDQDMINQLRPNMTKKQVLYIMGSPMLLDVFHQKRWDYLYSKQVGGEAREQKRITLYFEGDTLTGIQGDFRPDSQAAKASKETTLDVPARDLEKTLWETVLWLFSDEPEAKTVASPPETAAAPVATEPKSGENLKASKPVNSVPAAK
jgi:outer membrane protein assembly factor BamE